MRLFLSKFVEAARQVVLVHAPSFDSGEPMAEDIALTAANAASEILALFSRQLSDRELLLYGRVWNSGNRCYSRIRWPTTSNRRNDAKSWS